MLLGNSVATIPPCSGPAPSWPRSGVSAHPADIIVRPGVVAGLDRRDQAGVGQSAQGGELGRIDHHRLVGLAIADERDHTILATRRIRSGAAAAIDRELHVMTIRSACDTEAGHGEGRGWGGGQG